MTDPYGFSPSASISVGGYFPKTTGRSPSPRQRPVIPELAELVERQIKAIHQTYPAWLVVRLVDDHGVPQGWTATRHAELTDGQLAMGLLPFLAAGDAPALVMALAAQDAIAHPAGYAEIASWRVIATSGPNAPADGRGSK
ncbi:hypothetical protein [Sphaerisporangium sp. TRM90804]|uniref:hypothetical protein n=1 Tax=Sphaerisporangium sp. TRM90804 TaxID=3031113 RepID=UPI00244D4A4A|nr:hypothetical protein [Sphaerisporangium sp. TRM90804]MDH2427552.1 hypothetical protein [Sphaerisporangium sp. TRM90804]